MDPVFRPQPMLGVSMAVAAAFWLSVLVFLIQHPIVPPHTFISAAFFVLMFLLSVLYYARTAIVVDGAGVTYRGIVRNTRIAFDELQKLSVVPGLITVYTVSGGRKNISFTSIFQRHRELAALVRERAALN
jgi:hypothetical membrane protein